MTDGPTIRRAQPDDLEGCTRLYVEIGREEFRWRPASYFKTSDFLGFAEHDEVWVAVRDGTVGGFLAYFAPEHFLHLLFVDRGWRGRGVGVVLLDHARAHYGAPHSLKVEEPNVAARRFYERHGYVNVGIGEMDGVPWIELRSP